MSNKWFVQVEAPDDARMDTVSVVVLDRRGGLHDLRVSSFWPASWYDPDCGAAPTLLEALKALADCAQRSLDGEATVSAVEDAIAVARAAIAQAEGEGT